MKTYLMWAVPGHINNLDSKPRMHWISNKYKFTQFLKIPI